MEPKLGHGRICYIEMPSSDVARSAEFYQKVFGWNIRRRGDGSVSFDDGVGQVSGVWVLGRPAYKSDGMVVYIMVDNMDATLAAVKVNGGDVVQPVGAHAPEITAVIQDPSGVRSVSGAGRVALRRRERGLRADLTPRSQRKTENRDRARRKKLLSPIDGPVAAWQRVQA